VRARFFIKALSPSNNLEQPQLKSSASNSGGLIAAASIENGGEEGRDAAATFLSRTQTSGARLRKTLREDGGENYENLIFEVTLVSGESSVVEAELRRKFRADAPFSLFISN
jgi:hypothetical protein